MVYRHLERRIEPLKPEGRILAVDYGEKRIGLALSDPLKIFAKPYLMLENQGLEALVLSLKEIIISSSVQQVVLGIPWAIDGRKTPKTEETLQVLEHLKAHLEIPVIPWDERYSSDEAHKELKKMGRSWQQARLEVDAMAAAMILKSYLASL